MTDQGNQFTLAGVILQSEYNKGEINSILMWGHSVAHLVEALHYISEVGVIRILHLPHYGPGVNSASN